MKKKRMIKKMKQTDSDIDYYSMGRVIQQLTVYEHKLKKQAKLEYDIKEREEKKEKEKDKNSIVIRKTIF